MKSRKVLPMMLPTGQQRRHDVKKKLLDSAGKLISYQESFSDHGIIEIRNQLQGKRNCKNYKYVEGKQYTTETTNRSLKKSKENFYNKQRQKKMKAQ